MLFSIIVLFHRVNIRKIKDDLLVQSELSSILENVKAYVFEGIATRGSKYACGLDKRSRGGGQAIFISSLFLGKTVLNNTSAGL